MFGKKPTVPVAPMITPPPVPASAKPESKAPLDPPSFKDQGHTSEQRPQDKIDEAAMESFPASDPPASHHSEGVKKPQLD